MGGKEKGRGRLVGGWFFGGTGSGHTRRGPARGREDPGRHSPVQLPLPVPRCSPGHHGMNSADACFSKEGHAAAGESESPSGPADVTW